MYFQSFLPACLFVASALAQLSNPSAIGPSTSAADKGNRKTCDITKYGAANDGSADVSAAMNAAFTDCKEGGLILVPSGAYMLSQWVIMRRGSGWALQLDGTIFRDPESTQGGNMIFVQQTEDVEVFSSNGEGAIQGDGYLLHRRNNLSGPRLLRFYNVSSFSVHDIKLVDSPAFHLTFDTCRDGEVYNILVRGGDHGGLDGVDVWSDNMWIHDIMVTNKDECVTVKSPAHNILIENIYCNWSGGCALGSLGADTDIENIHYRNVYTQNSNNMMMIKSNGGSGLASNLMFENFIGQTNAYSLNIDQDWARMKTVEGNGVALQNMTFRNWKGTAQDGNQRGPIKLMCDNNTPCEGISLDDFSMWTETGSKQWYACRSAFGEGSDPIGHACLRQNNNANPTAYPVTTMTVTAAPTGFAAATMAEDLTAAFGYTLTIPTPAWPSSFYPDTTPVSALAAGAR